jgi:hypothetical protein
LLSPQQLHTQSKARGHEDSHFITEENTATPFNGGDVISCDYHDKIKIPEITCIPFTGTKQRQPPVKASFKQAITEPREIATYTSNLNIAQHELFHLPKTYAHVDMQEIQHKIRTGDIKSTRQVALCKIPKCQTCCEKKQKEISQMSSRVDHS